MSEMRYKDYLARIDFDQRDNIFVGRVLGLRDAISFHGTDVNELKTDFANAMEHYLAVCAKRGVEPERPYSGKLSLRISPVTHAAAARAAEAAGTSINQWVAHALEIASAHSSELRGPTAYHNGEQSRRPQMSLPMRRSKHSTKSKQEQKATKAPLARGLTSKSARRTRSLG